MYPQVLGPINILQSGIVLLVVDTFGRCPFVTSSISSFDILSQSMDLTQSKERLRNNISDKYGLDLPNKRTKTCTMRISWLHSYSFPGMRALPQQHQLKMSLSRNSWKTLTLGYLPQLEIFTGSILSLPHSKQSVFKIEFSKKPQEIAIFLTFLPKVKTKHLWQHTSY